MTETSKQEQSMTTEQTELIEKLNCLEFETSQLSHAYQLWRSYVEQGKAPEWMAAAIRVTYDALIAFCLDTVSTQELNTSHADEIECDAPRGETDPPLDGALLGEDGTTTLCLHHGQGLECDDQETDPPVRLTTLVDRSRVLTPVRQQNRIVGMLALADVPRAFSARPLAQLEASDYEISDILEEESTTTGPSPELLTVTELDWSVPEMPVAISPRPTCHEISGQPAIQQGQQEEEAAAERAAIRRLATLRLPGWLHGSSTGKLIGAASVAILMVAGAALGIYVSSPQRGAHSLPVENSAEGTVVIPTGEKAEFKFDHDPVVARLGSSFVLNAVLSRGSDIASVAAQIDYDANLLEFMGVSQGGFLVKAGRQVVLVQRNDPLSGVLKISAEQPQGKPGISGDGPVFALSFHARKKGNGTVSIVPSAHDSQGRRIEMAGSQVPVCVN
jgi:hypothetical protein